MSAETTTAKMATGQPPKKKLSWKERLALLPEDEAKAMRAKAAEASRISKAKKRARPQSKRLSPAWKSDSPRSTRSWPS